MLANDENSGPKTKGKRRSSILKIPKSPGNALDDIDPNSESNNETIRKSKKARRSSSRRVSFAETCQVKEIPNEVLDKMQLPLNLDGITLDENAGVVNPSVDFDSRLDECAYRQPASTLAGLSSLLSSPIQESSTEPRFREQFESTVLDESQLELTCCQPETSNDMQESFKSQNAMEMTRNYEGWEIEQSTVVRSRYSFTTKSAVVSSPRLKSAVHSPKRDGSSFLSQLRNVSNTASYQQNNRYCNSEPFVEARSTTSLQPITEGDELEFTRCVDGEIEEPFSSDDEVSINPMEMTRNYEGWQAARMPHLSTLAKSQEKPAHSSKMDGTLFLRHLEDSCNTSCYESQETMQQRGSARLSRRNEDLEFTRCFGAGLQAEKLQSDDYDEDNDVTGDQSMEMTGNYSNLQGEEPREYAVAEAETFGAENERSLNNQQNQDENLDFTSCVGEYLRDSSQPTFVDNDHMEMTKICNDWEDQSSSKCHDLEFTRHQAGNIETFLHESIGDISEMEMTKNYDNLEEQQSDIVETSQRDNRNSSNAHKTFSTGVKFGALADNTVGCTNRDRSVPRGSVETYSESPMVKAVPRASFSRITMDKNLQRFEIKLPTAKSGNLSWVKCEENSLITPQKDIINPRQPNDINLDDQIRINRTEKPDVNASDGQPGSPCCAEDIALNTSDVRDSISETQDKENKASTAVVNDDETHRGSLLIDTSFPNLSFQQTEVTDTKPDEEIEKLEAESKEETVPEKPLEPLTLKEFKEKAGISFLKFITRPSETPMIVCDIPKELKDKIYSKCLSDSKLPIMENFCRELEENIATDEQLHATKEEELNANNPPVFGILQRVMGTDKEDLVVDVLKQLNRVGQTVSKHLWYNKKKEMRTTIVIALLEQEKKLSADLATLTNYQKELTEDVSFLGKTEADCDKEIRELEATLESEEKEWIAYVEETDELKQKLNLLETELHLKEKERASLMTVKDALSFEIAEQNAKKMKLENAMDRLNEEKMLHESKVAEIRMLLPFNTALQEWVLHDYNDMELKFMFLARTLHLQITFESMEKFKAIQLISVTPKECSKPFILLGHQLIMETYSKCNFLTRFPTLDRLPKLMHEVSEACCRVRVLLEVIDDISINHIVYVNDKMLSVEFSSLAKFMKFILNFDLSKLVTDGSIAFTVVRKIGYTSAKAIAEQLKEFPATILYFKRILKTADQILKL